MNAMIAFLLAQDGLTNGAIYALVAIAIVMVFSVTRIIFVPQGEWIAYSALCLASLRNHTVPPLVWLLALGGALVSLRDFWHFSRDRTQIGALRSGFLYLFVPAIIAGMVALGAKANLPYDVQILLTLALIVPLGPIVYRLAYQPIENASVLVLLIASIAVHVVLLGAGLLMFGTEGIRLPAQVDSTWSVFDFSISGQSLFVMGFTVVVILVMFGFFGRTLHGKALRATAYNRVGARLMGISTSSAGTLTFALAALLGAIAGVLAGPLSTLYYDTGFTISLKGFVAAIFGGLVSYPLAAIGALALGGMESFSSFYASAFKDSIVFAAVIPILLLRSLLSPHESHDEEAVEE